MYLYIPSTVAHVYPYVGVGAVVRHGSLLAALIFECACEVAYITILLSLLVANGRIAPHIHDML